MWSKRLHSTPVFESNLEDWVNYDLDGWRRRGRNIHDFFALNELNGAFYVGKYPSTPENPAHAVTQGLIDLAAANGLELAALRHLSHGTTVATNA